MPSKNTQSKEAKASAKAKKQRYLQRRKLRMAEDPAYREQELAKERKRKNRWVEANREHTRNYHREYRAKNRLRLAQSRQKWEEENREALSAYRAQWYESNRERILEKQRARRAADPDYMRRWRRENPELVKASQATRRSRASADRATRREAADYSRILRNDPCSYCGADCEHIDHIAPLAAEGEHRFTNLTAACAQCNQSKNKRPLLTFLLERKS